MLRLSKYIQCAEEPDILPEKSILYSTRTGYAFEINNGMLKELREGNFEHLPYSDIERLIRAKVLVPADENELKEILESNKAAIRDQDDQIMSFTIQPSGNCQLGCHYCGQVHSKKVVNKETETLIFNRIRQKLESKKDTLKKMSITWYGGEPLTGLSELKALSSQLIDLSATYGIGYQASMITNGLALKERIFRELVSEHKIEAYQITLDGTREFHDKRRFLKNGNASFDVIFQNVREIVNSEFFEDSGAAINIRCNVDGENKDNIFELLAMLQAEGILAKVNIYVTPVHDWGDKENTKGINGISKEEFAQFEIDFYLALREYGELNNDYLLPMPRPDVCMVVSGTSEVLDAFGNVSTCWEIPYTPFYDNTDFYVGNLHNDPYVSSKQAPMRHWLDEIPTNDTWCKSCKFLPVCGGGCPKNWYQGTPACPSYKFNIEDRMFLKFLSAKENPERKKKTIIHQNLI